MASSIIATTIDETFPVAGVDNDSQGFRDNFSIIKDNFGYAKTEIEALQSETAKITGNNSFDNNTISDANLNKVTREANDGIVGDTDRPVSFTSGHYHIVDDVTAAITLTLQDWPNTGQYAEMFVEVKPQTSDEYGVTFASLNPAGTASTYLVDTDTSGLSYWSGRTLTLNSATDVRDVVKMWTYNGGLNVFVKHIGRFDVV